VIKSNRSSIQTDAMAEISNYKGIFRKNSNVLSMSEGATYFPGDNRNQHTMEEKRRTDAFVNMEVNYDFLKTLDITLLENV
jgi:hypothetical protein